MYIFSTAGTAVEVTYGTGVEGVSISTSGIDVGGSTTGQLEFSAGLGAGGK